MSSAQPEVAATSESASGDPDEPPSPGPSGSPSAHPLTILTADERSSGSAHDDVPVDLDALAALLSRVLTAEGVPAAAEASITLVDPDDIAALKAEHLDGDGSPTDVLSFPIDGAPDPDAAAATNPEATPAAAPWMVGDVVLCPQVAAAQAPTHAGTLSDELALLVVHSGLHLTGWDHADDDEREAMWARERQLLTQLHQFPARDPWSEPHP
jgi:probable rRNA maturation factor